jgi:hypothetical protein
LSPLTFTSDSSFDEPAIAWRWKNVLLAVDPVGRAHDRAGAARLRWPIIQSPIASK